MDKKTIENLKQFRKFDELLISTEKKYKENIDKFTKKDNNSKITSYIVPIIIDVSSNKEIIFSDKLSSEYVMAGNDLLEGPNIEAACKISLANFLNCSNQKYEYDLDHLFNFLVKNN